MAVIDYNVVLMASWALLFAACFSFHNIHSLRSNKDVINIPILVCREIMKDAESI